MNSKFLGEEKITKLLFRQALPATIGMLVMSLYNIVDTIYIGKGIGTLALAGVSVSLPIIMLFLAISLTIGIGAASIISRSLGSGNLEKVKDTLGNYILMLVVFSSIIVSLGYTFLTQIINFFGATPDIFNYAIEYASILLPGAIFFIFISSANNIIRSSGHAKNAMFSMLIGAVINLILDPIFIFYLNLGVKGAAYATVISWMISAIYILYYYFKINTIKINLKHLRLKVSIAKEILAVGASSFARQLSASIMIIVVNVALATFSTSLAIAAFGIISKLTMFITMPLFGIIQGMQPIIGFNWGGKKYNRVKETLLLSIKITSIFSLISFIFLILFPVTIVSVFTKDIELINLASNALKIVILMLPLIGIQLVAGGFYQSLGKARAAFILSILRQMILLVPLVLILPIYYKLPGVWYSFPISDFLAFLITIVFIYKEIHLLNKLISDQQKTSS